MRGADVNEINIEAVDLGHELRQGVQLRFGLSPVVAFAPIFNERLELAELDALRLVIIDKVPFPALQDPLLDARREHAGKDSFLVVDIPIAAASLAQAAGRLIRTATDHGVVAILDPRLTRKRYKPLVLHGVEHMPETTSLTEVEEFFLKRRDESDSPSRDW